MLKEENDFTKKHDAFLLMRINNPQICHFKIGIGVNVDVDDSLLKKIRLQLFYCHFLIRK